MRRLAGLALALGLAACVTQSAPPLPAAPLPHGEAIRIQATPVPDGPPGFIDELRLCERNCWSFTYAGGVHLTSSDTARLHGLSDLKVWPDGRLLAVGDQGDLLEARVVLDPAGRLAGLDRATLRPVLDEQGRQVTSLGAREYDAEGVAEFADGGRVIAFEQHDRILYYPPGGGPARPAPQPRPSFAFNSGMEALAALPQAGRDAYLIGVEGTGEVFLCRLAAACTPRGAVDVEGLDLTALAPLADGRTAYLLRNYIPGLGNRIVLKVVAADGSTFDRLELKRPRTVENFEGLAAVPIAGGYRFYMVSDDNFSEGQRTLLVAYDWRRVPEQKGRPCGRPLRNDTS